MPHCREPQKGKSDECLSQIASKFRMRDKDGICQPKRHRRSRIRTVSALNTVIMRLIRREETLRSCGSQASLGGQVAERHGEVGCRSVSTRAAARLLWHEEKTLQNCESKAWQGTRKCMSKIPSTPGPYNLPIGVSLLAFLLSVLPADPSVRKGSHLPGRPG